MSDFQGFPGISKATTIPNLFFTAVLPDMESPGELLAFLWVARITQERKVSERFVSEDEVWAYPGARGSFEHLGGGREGLSAALEALVRTRALLSLTIAGAEGEERLYLVNNPASRRLIARARSGDLQLRAAIVQPARDPEERPNIFRLYEEQIGTITPMVGDKLIEAEERYSPEWIAEAFREAAELNVRSWRYIERILIRWAEEGRSYETPGRDPLEDEKQRFLGGFEHLANRR